MDAIKFWHRIVSVGTMGYCSANDVASRSGADSPSKRTKLFLIFLSRPMNRAVPQGYGPCGTDLRTRFGSTHRSVQTAPPKNLDVASSSSTPTIPSAPTYLKPRPNDEWTICRSVPAKTRMPIRGIPSRTAEEPSRSCGIFSPSPHVPSSDRRSTKRMTSRSSFSDV